MACLSVSQLNELARESLQTCFDPEVWVKGEIHGFKVHAKSGHLYFDLVEKAPAGMDGYIAKISCAFFRGPYVKWRSSLASFDARFDLNSALRSAQGRIDLFVKGRLLPAHRLGYRSRLHARHCEKRATIAPASFDFMTGTNEPFLSFPNIGLITGRSAAGRLHDHHGQRLQLFHHPFAHAGREHCRVPGIRVLQNHPGSMSSPSSGRSKTDLFSAMIPGPQGDRPSGR